MTPDTLSTCRSLAVVLALLTPLDLRAEAPPSETNPTFKVSDPAPALATGKWIKGEPVKSFESSKVYVVEFWATWCVPCRQAIPHLSELQAKYKDEVIIIGQNCLEQTPSAVEPFVAKMGKKMNYRVALDDIAKEKHGVMAKTWLEAADALGIPWAFLVGKDSKIAWIGDARDVEKILPRVLNGTFDAQKRAEYQKQVNQFFEAHAAACDAGDWNKDLKLIEELAGKYPEDAIEWMPLKFLALLRKKEYQAAYKFAVQLAGICKDDPFTLSWLASCILDEDKREKRDLDLALKWAMAANELIHSENPGMLVTLAEAFFAKGDVERAIDYANQALAKSEPQDKEYAEKALKKFQQKEQNGQKTSKSRP